MSMMSNEIGKEEADVVQDICDLSNGASCQPKAASCA